MAKTKSSKSSVKSEIVKVSRRNNGKVSKSGSRSRTDRGNSQAASASKASPRAELCPRWKAVISSVLDLAYMTLINLETYYGYSPEVPSYDRKPWNIDRNPLGDCPRKMAICMLNMLDQMTRGQRERDDEAKMDFIIDRLFGTHVRLILPETFDLLRYRGITHDFLKDLRKKVEKKHGPIDPADAYEPGDFVEMFMFKPSVYSKLGEKVSDGSSEPSGHQSVEVEVSSSNGNLEEGRRVDDLERRVSRIELALWPNTETGSPQEILPDKGQATGQQASSEEKPKTWVKPGLHYGDGKSSGDEESSDDGQGTSSDVTSLSDGVESMDLQVANENGFNPPVTSTKRKASEKIGASKSKRRTEKD